MVLLGLGAGVSFPALMMLAMSGATQSDAGLASGLVNTTLQVGGAIGLAVLATLATTHTDALLEDGEATASALTGGYHLAFLIGVGLVIVAFLVALSVLRQTPWPWRSSPHLSCWSRDCLLGGGMSATGLGLPMSSQATAGPHLRPSSNRCTRRAG